MCWRARRPTPCIIADTAIEMGINPATDLKVRAGIFGAEPCSQGMRDEIAEKLGVQYCDVYGLSEVMGPGVAFECKAMSGLHLAEDHFFAEIIDPDTLQPVPDGECGELVFTTLTRECCPLVRYRTRDITRIISEPCPCGRTHRKIDRIIGPHRRHAHPARRERVPVPDRAGASPASPRSPRSTRSILTTRGPLDHVELRVETVPEFPFDEIRKLETLEEASGRRTQGQPADRRGHQARRAQVHRAQRGQGQAHHRPAKGVKAMISQLTVFLENEKGRLAAATRAVADAGVNMHALYLADTEDFGVARMLCDTPNKAAEKLTLAGWRAAVTPVMAVRVPDVPGGLASLLEFLDACDVNVEYGYCMSVEGGHAIDVLKVSGDEEIERKLADAGFAPVSAEDVYIVD